ncbi:MAG: glycosyltransferase [Actinomycetota bacterium]|nr:glycosyltransferase [Actinomycetota bacterium]
MRFAFTVRDARLDIPGGIGTSVFSIASELIGQGHETYVVGLLPSCSTVDLAQTYGVDPLPQIIEIARSDAPTRPKSVAAWLTRGATILSELRPDAVVVNGALPLRLRYPTIFVSHDLEERGRGNRLSRSLYKRVSYATASCVAATCSEVQAGLASQLGMNRGAISLLPTCVKIARYKPQALATRTRTVLHIGTTAYKNPCASIRAFGEISDSAASLLITGPPTEDVREAIRVLHPTLRENVEVLGYIPSDELISLLGSVRAVSIPSKYDVPVASPTALEAMASATPFLETGSISKDLLGEASPDSDVVGSGGLQAAMERLLSDDDYWQARSEQVRQRAEQFSAETIASRYLALVGSLSLT